MIWSASPEGVVNTETGEVTQPADGDKIVTLTAQMNEVGGEGRQQTKTFTVTVPAPDYGWGVILEQPSYADETALREEL